MQRGPRRPSMPLFTDLRDWTLSEIGDLLEGLGKSLLDEYSVA